MSTRHAPRKVALENDRPILAAASLAFASLVAYSCTLDTRGTAGGSGPGLGSGGTEQDGADAASVESDVYGSVDGPLDAYDSTPSEPIDDVSVSEPSEDADAVPDAVPICNLGVTDVCSSIVVLDNIPIAIDGGTIDDCLLTHLLAADPTKWYLDNSLTKTTAPTNVAVEYAVARVADQGLWVFVRVHKGSPVLSSNDPLSPQWGDAVEIFVDNDGSYAKTGEYDDPGTRQFIVPAPSSDDPDGGKPIALVYQGSYYLSTLPSEHYSSQLVGMDGYVVNVLITPEDLAIGPSGPPVSMSNAQIGFDLVVDVCPHAVSGGKCGKDDTTFLWCLKNVAPGRQLEDWPAANTQAFCNPAVILPSD
jgi:hypothetical protein